jgi:hypothetical protein
LWHGRERSASRLVLADALDEALKASCFKPGVPAGFLSWLQVALTVEDLRHCAVVLNISRELGSEAPDLGTLEAEGLLASWQPCSNPGWFDRVKSGQPFRPDEPFLLRQSVNSELPASWYLEDGSGRATAIIANASQYEDQSVVAYGFLGKTPDDMSTFMQTKFASLLNG